MIKTRVTLSSGRVVAAYYLEEKDRQQFSELKRSVSVLELHKDVIYADLGLLFTLLAKQLTAYYKAAILEQKESWTTSTSFHTTDLWVFIPVNHKGSRGAGYQSFEDAFQELVNEHKIVSRGSGWFRFAEETTRE